MPVQYKTDHFFVRYQFKGLLYVIYRRCPRMDDHDDEINERCEGKGIGADQYRRHIEKDKPVRVACLHIMDKVFHARRSQEFRALLYHPTSGDKGQLVYARPDHEIGKRLIIYEVVKESFVIVEPEDLVDTLLSQVAINKEHGLLKLLCKCKGKVDGGERLAFAGLGARDHDRVAASLLGILEDLGAEDLVLLRFLNAREDCDTTVICQ